MGQDLVTKLRKHPELGIQIAGFLTSDQNSVGTEIHGIKVVGKYSDVRELITKRGIDIILVALPFHAHNQLKEVLEWIGDETVSIMVLPDLFEFVTLRGSVSEFEGMPLISLRDTPLYGWNIIVKRVLDIVFSSLVIIFTSPVMLIIAILIKLTSGGPLCLSRKGWDWTARHSICLNSERCLPMQNKKQALFGQRRTIRDAPKLVNY